MNRKASHENLNRSVNRHIFDRLRRHIRFAASAVYMLFGVFDYMYAPEHFKLWIALRCCFVISVFGLFEAAKRFKSVRIRMQWVAAMTIAFACWPISIMIYQSGGVHSFYLAGLILIGTTGLQVFRLRKQMALISLAASFLPAIVICFATVATEEIHLAFIQSGFLIGMIILSFIYGASEEQLDIWWAKYKKITKAELQRYQRTEILKNHFPKVIRDSFEQNPGSIFQKKIIENAVVGFTDIVASSQISNEVPIAIDWELKERFLEAATQRAIASEMVVLNHLGDGFLFLANYNESAQWYYNLMSFYEGLVSDFRKISTQLNLSSTGIDTGVKFGVSCGPAMVGFIGQHQSYFTAMGPDVNLASRLCAVAQADQIVLSSRVWQSVRPLLIGWNFRTEIYQNIKGFDYPISAIHISPRSITEKSTVCSTCGKVMSLIRTEDGFLDYRCIDGHTIPQNCDTRMVAND